MKPILIASDHGGFALKEELKAFLARKKRAFKDLGPYSAERCDYPDYAFPLAQAIGSGKYTQGILICKSGIGNSIVANRVPGVRAALCHNIATARLSREHNDANVLVLGAQFVPAADAKRMLSVWLATPFLKGRHAKRLKLLRGMERGLMGAQCR